MIGLSYAWYMSQINHHLYLYICKARFFFFFNGKLYFHQLFLLLPRYLLFIYFYFYFFFFWEWCIFSVSDTGILGKGNPSAPIRNRTYDLPITSSDTLPLSYRRLEVGFKKHFSMFGNRMKSSSSCLLYSIKLNRANLFIKRRFFFFLKVSDIQEMPIFFKTSRKPFEGRSGLGKYLPLSTVTSLSIRWRFLQDRAGWYLLPFWHL